MISADRDASDSNGPAGTVDTSDPDVVRVLGECDAPQVSELRAAIESRLDATGRAAVDLSAVSFIGSAGLGVLAAAHRRSTTIGTDFAILNPSQYVVRMLEIAGLADYLTVRHEA